MSYVINPQAPERLAALVGAEKIARALRQELPEYEIRIEENIHARFHVIVAVPFRWEERTPAEREAEATWAGVEAPKEV